jgi:hypothetical protein
MRAAGRLGDDCGRELPRGSIEQSAEHAHIALKRSRNLAKLPVLGFELSELPVHIKPRRGFHKDRPLQNFGAS